MNDNCLTRTEIHRSLSMKLCRFLELGFSENSLTFFKKHLVVLRVVNLVDISIRITDATTCLAILSC